MGLETKIQKEGFDQLVNTRLVLEGGRDFVKLEHELVDIDKYIANAKKATFAQILKSWRLDRVRGAQVVSALVSTFVFPQASNATSFLFKTSPQLRTSNLADSYKWEAYLL